MLGGKNVLSVVWVGEGWEKVSIDFPNASFVWLLLPCGSRLL